jgi:hypothetical protein
MKCKVFYNSAFKDKRGLYWTSWKKGKYTKLNFVSPAEYNDKGVDETNRETGMNLRRS